MLKKIYARIMRTVSTDSFPTDNIMYYDKEWAMVRRVKNDNIAVSYCASPLIPNRKVKKDFIEKYLKSNKLA